MAICFKFSHRLVWFGPYPVPHVFSYSLAALAETQRQ